MTRFLALAGGLPDFNLATIAGSSLVVHFIELGLRVAYAAVLLGLGLWVVFTISRQINRRIAASRHIDPTLGRFFGTIARYLMMALVLIAVLQKFGVQTTSLVAMLGAATLAVGMALQGTLGDLAAGVLIIVFRPYRLGDSVDLGGKQGRVENISIFYTSLITFDNRRIVIHNSRAWGDPIENFSVYPTRQIDLTVGVSYEDDLDHAIAVARRTLEEYDAIHSRPPPTVAVRNLADSAVNLVIRGWTDTDVFGDAGWELTRRIKLAFDAEGIAIPYPHQVSIQHTPSGPAGGPAEEAERRAG